MPTPGGAPRLTSQRSSAPPPLPGSRTAVAGGERNTWLVDPPQRTLEVLRLLEREWLIASVHAGNERVRAEPFDAIELDLGILWADVVLESP